MRVKTYEHPLEHAILPVYDLEPGKFLQPGDWVRHADWTDSLGVLIANNEESLTVLWSRLPGPKQSIYNNPTGQGAQQYLDAGYVFAPYVPQLKTPTIFTPEDFAPRKGVMTRYGKKQINASFYGTVSVMNVVSGST